MKLTVHGDCSSARRERLDELIAWWQGDDSHMEVSTSGSTGTPKLIAIEREAIVASIHATHDALSSHASGHHARMLIALPLDTIGGIMAVFRALTWGWDIDLLPASRTLKWEGSASMISLVPQQALALSPEMWSRVEIVLLGGGPLSQSGRSQLQPFADQIWEGFGMTETLSHIALKRLNESCYHPVSGVNISTQADGALVIHAPHLGLDQLVTQDVVEVEDGCFKWLGRKDLVINSAGKKIHPEVVESAMEQAGSPRGMMTWVEHPDWGQAAVWLMAASAPADVGAYDKALATLPSWQRPKACYHVELPLTANGKLNRAAAQRLAQELALA